MCGLIRPLGALRAFVDRTSARFCPRHARFWRTILGAHRSNGQHFFARGVFFFDRSAPSTSDTHLCLPFWEVCASGHCLLRTAEERALRVATLRSMPASLGGPTNLGKDL